MISESSFSPYLLYVFIPIINIEAKGQCDSSFLGEMKKHALQGDALSVEERCCATICMCLGRGESLK
jgi:hypothetical protein